MEHRKAVTCSITMINASNNNNSHHHLNRRKKRLTKRQQLPSPSLTSKDQHVPFILTTTSNSNQQNAYTYEPQKERISMKNPLAWTKRWTKWFSPCGSEDISQTDLYSASISTDKRSRTKSENDVSKRASIDQNEKKKLPTTNSSFAVGQSSDENQDEQQQQTKTLNLYQLGDQVNTDINPVVYRDRSRRYSNTFFTSARYGGPRKSIAVIPTSSSTTTTATNTFQQKPSTHLSRSVDRLLNKSNRREIRYEEHDEYIPPLHSIQCHPSIDHYAKNLNQSTYFSSNQRRSQIETNPLLSINNRSNVPRPYSSNIPLSHSLQIMSKATVDNKNKNNTYGKLSECHSPLTPLENSSVKAPRRIESAYSQFPIHEPVYANTQSLYDNILYPQATSRDSNQQYDQEKKSCASQTQLTWTMATFSSFVDLENQSIIIPQPDPNTVYSIVQHYHTEPPPSASPETVEQMKRMSPNLRYIDDPNSSNYYQRPRSPASPTLMMVEKRDGLVQTLLSIAPTQDFETSKQLFIHDSTPSPISSSSTTPGQQKQSHHHHHHHRKHKSRTNGSGNHISTRDVGLQVNIQTVKKITFSSQKSDELSLPTTSPTTTKSTRELRNVETNTEPIATKRDKSTSYESSVHLVTSSSQTIDAPTTITTNRQTKAAQTSNKTLRDQSIETNHRGLFVCDLSSLLKPGLDESSSSTSSSLTTKRKS